MTRWESSVEKQIREAIEAGKFDDLPGKGEPIDLTENPFEDPDLRTAHRLLRNAGFAPAFIEERKQIDAELEQARTKLVRARAIYNNTGSLSDRDALWDRTAREFRETTNGLNARIKTHNPKVPAGVFSRKLIEVEFEIQCVMSEDPPPGDKQF